MYECVSIFAYMHLLQCSIVSAFLYNIYKAMGNSITIRFRISSVIGIVETLKKVLYIILELNIK